MEEFLDIGRISRPKGLGGAVWVQVWSDDPERLLKLDDFFIQRRGRRERLCLDEGVWQNGKLLLLFEGISSREEAEALKGLSLQIHQRDLPELDEEEFFLDDLPGLTVKLGDGQCVGTVHEILEMPASDVLVIRAGDCEALVPLIPEFLGDVDVPGGFLVIQPIEGMLPEGMLAAAAKEAQERSGAGSDDH